MKLLELGRLLRTTPDLASLLTFKDLITFGDLVTWLHDEIVTVQLPDVATPPPTLPAKIHDFFRDVFSLTDDDTKRLWDILQHVAWSNEPIGELEEHRAHALAPLFLKYGFAHGLSMSLLKPTACCAHICTGFYNLRPPTRVCLDSRCNKKRTRLADGGYDVKAAVLTEPMSHEVLVFTRDLGPVAAQATSLYCRGKSDVVTQVYMTAHLDA